MRTDVSWFAERMGTTWSVQPGRSFLLLVPACCDMDGAAASVRDWCSENVKLPASSNNAKAALIPLTVDHLSSSNHFVNAVSKGLARVDPEVCAGICEDYPSDELGELVNNAHAHGLHPVFIINRFQAFARIADEHLLSVLARMRTLEHDQMLTTLALSTQRYQTIRAALNRAGHFPFVNSAYGDNHDEAGLRPLSREEFVAAGTKVGLSAPQCHQLFAYAGGPDDVSKALIECAAGGVAGVIERACARLGNNLERFFDNAIDPELPDRDDLRQRLATGQLQPSQEDYLEASECAAFLARRSSSGRLMPASPVVGRLLLRGREGPWRQYDEVLSHVRAGDFAAAAATVDLLDQRSRHLQTFAGLVHLLRACYADNDSGLLAIDWLAIGRLGKTMLKEPDLLGCHSGWVRSLVAWSERVKAAVDPGLGPNVRLEVLARGAGDPDVQSLLVFLMETFLRKVSRHPSPARRLREAAVLPESMLQSLAYSMAIDVRAAPANLPSADYQAYFNPKLTFQAPVAGGPITMTQLLVIVPALLADRKRVVAAPLTLTDPAHVVPLLTKLVERLRNTEAHTYSEVTAKDAQFLITTCETWLEDIKEIWDLKAVGQAGIRPPPPSADDLAALLYRED